MNTEEVQSFPWSLIPALIGFFITFVLQFRLKYHIDREKVMKLEDMKDLYPSSPPPRAILTPRGQHLYTWFYVGTAMFLVFLIITMIFYG